MLHPVTISVTSRYPGRAVAVATEVTAIHAVVHAEVLSAVATEVVAVAVIVSATAHSVPGVISTIGGIEVRTSEV